MSAPLISIIIPVHNEEHRLPKALEQLISFRAQQPYEVEVLVVENGSTDRTVAVAESFLERMPDLHILQERARGKGLAVRRGMLEARGDYRMFCDVDFSMPVAEISRFIPPALPDMDIAIASREAPGAVRYGEPNYRHLVGRAFNTMVRWLALPGLQDTQCGFKCFRGPVAQDVFSRQTLTGWSFDVEVLFIARRHGYRIVEVPIPWYFNPESRVRLVQDSYHMAMDLFTIRWKGLRGHYNGQV